jgi:hypothetical protein
MQVSGKKVIEGAMEALNIAETIKRLTDEDLLRELIRRNGIVEAPTSRTPHEYEVLLGIGKDHHCYITFTGKDVEALTGCNKLVDTVNQ